MTLGIATIQVDNERTRVTEWRFAPGAETGEHLHEYDYVVVPGMDGILKIVDPEGHETFAEMKEGVSYFREKGFITTSSTPMILNIISWKWNSNSSRRHEHVGRCDRHRSE